MNEKRTALLTVCLLGAFLLTFSLWAYLKPDDAFSQSERRKLTPKPSCTVESIYSGRYMSDFETYAPDQFPLREQFRTLRSLTSLYLLRQRDTNGVYLAEGYVSRLEYPMQEDSIAHAARRFDYLYDTYLSGTNCRLYLSVIPDKNAFLASSHGYPALDYGAFTQSLREKAPYLTYLPIGDLLSLEDYYRTDLHWRQEQLTDVAARLLEGMGAEAPGTFQEETLPTPYYGVYYGYAALPMEPDTIRYLTNDTLESCTVYHYETGQTTGIYDGEKGAGRDPYEWFLSGSESLLTVENPHAATDRELVIFRDSFASSLAPLLVEQYARITLVDIRYLSSTILGKYLTFTDQDVLFLYSVPVLNHSDTLK